MKIYVASSWRNTYQPTVVEELRKAGHEVYDFKNPEPRTGFQWSDIDPEWKDWTFGQYKAALEHETARAGFASDFNAMQKADVCVLVLPCNRSAHLEAGWMKGAGKRTFIYMPEMQEPELMYRMCDGIFDDLGTLISCLSVCGRMIYFGTDGGPGHHARTLNFRDEAFRMTLTMFLDSDVWLSRIEQRRYYYPINFGRFTFSIYAVPFSVDDTRPGCHTELWWEGMHPEEEMREFIRNDVFLKRQFAL